MFYRPGFGGIFISIFYIYIHTHTQAYGLIGGVCVCVCVCVCVLMNTDKGARTKKVTPQRKEDVRFVHSVYPIPTIVPGTKST